MPVTGILCAVLVPPSPKQCRSAGEDSEKGRLVRALEQLQCEEGFCLLDKDSNLKRDGRATYYRSWSCLHGEGKRRIFLDFPLQYKN